MTASPIATSGLSSAQKKKLLEAKMAELKLAKSKPMAVNTPAARQIEQLPAKSSQNADNRAEIQKVNPYMQPVQPIKSRQFELAHSVQNGRQSSSIIQALNNTASQETFAFDLLLAWTGLEAMPLSTLTPVIPVCGSTTVAAGIAMSLVHQHDNAASRQKIALLEWAQPESCLNALINLDAPQTGLSELFQKKCDLTHLMLNAKLYRPTPNLYAIGQGGVSKSKTTTDALVNEPFSGLPQLSQLMVALSRKFHRVVLSLPSYETEPRLPEILKQLGLYYGLFYDPLDKVIHHHNKIKTQWPEGIIQRLT